MTRQSVVDGRTGAGPSAAGRGGPLRRLANGAPARRRRPRAGERGAVSAELVVAIPLLMLLLLLVAQFALWAHATHIAQAAAAQALAAARASNGTAAAGTAEAQRVLAELGHGPLREATVSVARDGQHTTVRVSGTTTPVLPFLHLPAHGEAAGPVEIFRPGPGTP